MDRKNRYLILFAVTLFFALTLSNSASAGTWNNTTIDKNSGNGHSSIAIDKDGNTHISYYNSSNGDLDYLTKTKTGWIQETTDIAGCNPSLTMDNNDTPHIAYYDTVNNNLCYATKSGDNWIHETITSSSNIGYYYSMKIDNDGNPNVAYISGAFCHYAKRINGTWIDESVGRVGSWSDFKPTLVIDNNNTPHVVYGYFSASMTGYLEYSTRTSEGWVTD